jgi:nucleolar protein 58
MLVLYETAMGYCLFKVTDTAKIESADLWREFESPEKASRLYVLLWSELGKCTPATFFFSPD